MTDEVIDSPEGGAAETAEDDAALSAPPRDENAEHVADAKEHPLDPAAVEVARLTGYVVVGSICAPGPIALLSIAVFASLPGGIEFGLFAAWLAIGVGGAALARWWPAVRHRHIRYRVDHTGLTIWKGVLWRAVTSVPRSRVQHTDVSQGPLQRRYGIATLVVHTAGTQDASVSLSGLAHAAALQVRDYLVEADAGR